MVAIPHVLPILAPVVGGTAVLVWRFRETRSPVTVAKIVVPPLGMSTGFVMFALPSMRIPPIWGVAAFLAGALLLAEPLIRSSRLRREGDTVWLQRSHGFLVILLALLALRLLLHEWVGTLLPARETASLFFVLAFGMILRWRVGMYLDYRRLTRGPPDGPHDAPASPPDPTR